MRFPVIPAALKAAALYTATTATLFVFTSVSDARADLGPPSGQKFVEYSFTVSGVTKTPDRVLFAYPCGTANGRPYEEAALVREGTPISVSRRGGACVLYSTSKASWDEFEKTYSVNTELIQDPKLKAFADKATKCTGAPTPSFILSTSDSRNSLEEKLDVTTLSASECAVKSQGAPEQPKPTNGSDPDPGGIVGGGSSAPGTNNSNSNGTGAAGSGNSGDDGCSVAGRVSSAAPWLIALAVPVLLRRRKQAKK